MEYPPQSRALGKGYGHGQAGSPGLRGDAGGETARPTLRMLKGGLIRSASTTEAHPDHDDAEAKVSVINLEKHFLAKQIRNRHTMRTEPGALVLLRVFNPRQPA